MNDRRPRQQDPSLGSRREISWRRVESAAHILQLGAVYSRTGGRPVTTSLPSGCDFPCPREVFLPAVCPRVAAESRLKLPLASIRLIGLASAYRYRCSEVELSPASKVSIPQNLPLRTSR